MAGQSSLTRAWSRHAGARGSCLALTKPILGRKRKEPCYVNLTLTNQKGSGPCLATVEVERASANAQDSDQVGPRRVIGNHLSQANRMQDNKCFKVLLPVFKLCYLNSSTFETIYPFFVIITIFFILSSIFCLTYKLLPDDFKICHLLLSIFINNIKVL